MRSACLTLICLVYWAAASPAQQFVPTGRGTLTGLTGVEVVVEPLPPEVERPRFSTQTLRAAIEGRLATGAVTIYRSQAANPSPAQPYVYVFVNALSLEHDRRTAVGVQVQLRQTLQSLVTNARVVDAVTWDRHNVLVIPADDIGALQTEIDDIIDQFVADWLAAH